MIKSIKGEAIGSLVSVLERSGATREAVRSRRHN